MSSISREVVTIGIPNLAIGKELREFAIGIIDNRVALHIILLAVQLYVLDADDIMIPRIVVSTCRLDDIIIVHQYTSTLITTHLLLGIETEIVGIEKRIAIYHLNNRCVNLCQTGITIVDSAITIYIY